jgi:hypothetical protein
MAFEPPVITTDTDELTVSILDGLADRLPGWEPVEGSVETALAEEFAAQTAVVAQAAVDSILVSLVSIGESVYGLAAEQATPAQLPVLVTVSGIGDVIPAGLVLVGTNPAGVEVAFEVPDDVVATDTDQRVLVTATDVGTAHNGVAGDLVVATATAVVVSARTLTENELNPDWQPVPGVDAETATAYLERLVEHLSTLRVGGVTAEDLAAVARTVPGVYRAVGVDLLDPENPNDITENSVTLAAVDVNGDPVSAEVLAAVATAVEAAREINLNVGTTNPTTTQVIIEFAAIADQAPATSTVGGGTIGRPAAPNAIRNAIVAAVRAYLRPGWGLDPTRPRSWVNKPVLGYLDVVRIITQVPGVAALTSLTINGETTDLTLEGPVPYPAPFYGSAPSIVAGTVT